MAVAISASAGITKSPISKKIAKYEVTTTKLVKATRANGLIPPSTPIQFKGWSKFATPTLRSDAAITWNFEDSIQIQQFQLLDNDGDGHNWTYFDNTGLESGRMTPHDGEGVVCSASYDNDNKVPLTPDNWLISPQVTLGGVLSFWACGQDASYCSEVFGVYVCVGTPSGTSDFVQVGADYTATGDYLEYQIDLSEYQGQVGCFAIVHHNVTDMFWLNVDDITLDAGAAFVPRPVVPQNLAVTPTTTSAYVEWDADENAEGYDVAYRPYVDLTGNPIDCDFSLADYSEDLDGWWVYDVDGDGETASLYYSSSAQNDVCVGFESYNDTTANFFGSPDVQLKGKIEFAAWNYNASTPDTLMVYAMVGDDMYYVFDEPIIPGTRKTTYTADLSDFGGVVGNIVFLHLGYIYSSSSEGGALFLDDIFIGDPDAEIVEPAAWTYINVTDGNSTTIEGLTPETTYEVMVMAYQGDYETDWTDIVQFTTLAEPVPDVYMLGGDDQAWDCTSGTKFDYNAEDNIYTKTITFPAEYNYFGFTTVLAENNDNGGWEYIEPYRFGAVADGENFEYNDSYNGRALDLTKDAYKAFRIPAGEYKLTVDLTMMKLIIEKVVPAHDYDKGDVNHDHAVNIADVTALIDYLLETGTVCEICADVNGDGSINIADVTALIDVLLNNNN